MGRLGRIDGPSLASVGYLVPRTGKLPALVVLTARVRTLDGVTRARKASAGL